MGRPNPPILTRSVEPSSYIIGKLPNNPDHSTDQFHQHFSIALMDIQTISINTMIQPTACVYTSITYALMTQRTDF